MKKEERKTVASAIVRRSRRLSLEELAARGKRHVRVLTAGEAFDEIESVVDETSTKRANEIATHDRAWVFEEARQQFERAERLRTDSERLMREQTEKVRGDADRVGALERQLREELQELKSSVKALEQKSSSPDPGYVEKLFDELARREEASRSELETRLETTMSATIDAVRRTVLAALKGTGDTSVDATSLIVSKVLDDQAAALESNVGGIRVVESRVAESGLGGGVRENLARLKQLRRGPAAEAAPAGGTAPAAQENEPAPETGTAGEPAAAREAAPAAPAGDTAPAAPAGDTAPAAQEKAAQEKAAQEKAAVAPASEPAPAAAAGEAARAGTKAQPKETPESKPKAAARRDKAARSRETSEAKATRTAEPKPRRRARKKQTRKSKRTKET